MFTPRTFSAAHWSVVVKPTNRKPAGGGIFSPTWKFAQISKTWSEPGRCRKLSVFAAAATERGCQERPGFEGNEPTATSRWWAFCLQIHCLRLLGNSHKLNEQNLHKTQSLCPIISYIIRTRRIVPEDNDCFNSSVCFDWLIVPDNNNCWQYWQGFCQNSFS